MSALAASSSFSSSSRSDHRSRARLNSLVLTQIIRSPSMTVPELNNLLSNAFNLNSDDVAQLADTLDPSEAINTSLFPNAIIPHNSYGNALMSPFKHLKSLFTSPARSGRRMRRISKVKRRGSLGAPKLEMPPSDVFKKCFDEPIAPSNLIMMPSIRPSIARETVEPIDIPTRKSSSETFDITRLRTDTLSSLPKTPPRKTRLRDSGVSLARSGKSHYSIPHSPSSPSSLYSPAYYPSSVFDTPTSSQSSCVATSDCSQVICMSGPEQVDSDPFAKGLVQIVRRSHGSYISSESTPSRSTHRTSKSSKSPRSRKSKRRSSMSIQSIQDISRPESPILSSLCSSPVSMHSLPPRPSNPTPLTPQATTPSTPRSVVSVTSSNRSYGRFPKRRSSITSKPTRTSHTKGRADSPFPFDISKSPGHNNPQSQWWGHSDEEDLGI